MFLSAPVAKASEMSILLSLWITLPLQVLIVAGTDRLDKPLTIGQMQGKFQYTVLPAVGHTVQEDDPARTATTLLQFADRNRIGKPIVPVRQR